MQFWLSSTQRAPSTPIFAGQRLAHQGFSVRYRWLFGGLKKRYFARFGELRTILGADKAKHGKRHGMKDGCMVCFWRGSNAAILKISKRWGEFPDQKLRFGKGKKRPPFWQCLNWPSGWFWSLFWIISSGNISSCCCCNVSQASKIVFQLCKQRKQA